MYNNYYSSLTHEQLLNISKLLKILSDAVDRSRENVRFNLIVNCKKQQKMTGVKSKRFNPIVNGKKQEEMACVKSKN